MNDTLQQTHEKHIIAFPILWIKKLRLGGSNLPEVLELKQYTDL